MKAWIHSSLSACPSYQTKDGSSIRELMHPGVQGNQRQSLAEARVAPGQITLRHRHHRSEELYHVTRGTGCLEIDGQTRQVGAGDTVCIPAGSWHRIENTGTEELVFLCCSSPPYAHDDTELHERA